MKVTGSRPTDTVTISAKGEVLGRLASRVAGLLQGKNRLDYARQRPAGPKIILTDAAELVVTGRKYEQKTYFRHSGYLGHGRTISFKEAMSRPEFVIRHAVAGMLPKNRLRRYWLNHLIIQP